MHFKLLCAALISGFIFGLGLILSGMTNPAKIIGFLDVAGAWDASLLFVMIGAISVSFFAFKWAKRNTFSLLNAPIQLPKKQVIDFKLLSGAALFGVGWGLSGFCPGPAIVSLSTQPEKAPVFLLAMLAGILVYKVINK